jgi:hypothetical protein
MKTVSFFSLLFLLCLTSIQALKREIYIHIIDNDQAIVYSLYYHQQNKLPPLSYCSALVGYNKNPYAQDV